jgi:agmatinase
MGLKDGSFTLNTKFMASSKSYENSDVVIVGVPMDFTCSFRPGTRFGPQKIREVSIGIEEYSVFMDRSLEDVSFYDCGDLDLPFGNVDKSLEMIGMSANEIIEDGKFPIFIGGEHLISVPVIKEIYKKYGNELIVVQFDAHADLREGYLGCPNSHASAMRRLTEFMSGKNIFQFGIRSGTKDEFKYANVNTNLFKFDVLDPLLKVLPSFGDRPIYFTLDIDVADPAYVNGTGTPEPGGIDSRELLNAVHVFKDLNLIGFDLVEVSPVYDTSERTAVFASKIIRDIILMAGELHRH